MAKGVFVDEPDLFATVEGLRPHLVGDLEEDRLWHLEVLSWFKSKFKDDTNLNLVLKWLYSDQANEEDVLDLLKDAKRYDWPINRVLRELDLDSLNEVA